RVYEWNGLAYHYIDEPPVGGGEPAGTVLAVHGNAAWSFIYRKIVAPLTEAGFRVVATDQFGFGMSDKPPVSRFGYMPHDHAEVLADFIRDVDLREIYLVLQDWGGPIGLAAGIEEQHRVRALVIMNTWAWSLPEIPPGETAFMHAVHDRGVHAATEAAFYRSGELIRRGGLGVARRNAEEGTPEYIALRNAMWAPYLELTEPYELLHEDIMDAVHISAMATVRDGAFLRRLDESLGTLTDVPAYFAFGDDTAFGPYKVDLGFLGEPRALCMEGFAPEYEEVDARTNCVDAAGRPYWYPLERFLDRWNEDKVVGVWKDASVGHWVQDEAPHVVVDAIEQLYAYTRRNRR
ncbi:MAG: alpha/beta fold hydrolase, partial [Spirochaetales bacterium]|nr:alpha/beta fold hydrolase [Spirochaetales bacterium]